MCVCVRVCICLCMCVSLTHSQNTQHAQARTNAALGTYIVLVYVPARSNQGLQGVVVAFSGRNEDRRLRGGGEEEGCVAGRGVHTRANQEKANTPATMRATQTKLTRPSFCAAHYAGGKGKCGEGCR